MKPENRFIKRVHDQLHPDVYREKMFNPMRGGTPDCYYMGYVDDLWVEYKWVAKLPALIKPALSPLQLAWLVRAHDRGRRPWAVVGSPTGSVVILEPAQWSKGKERGEARVYSDEDLALEIQNRCGLAPSPAQQSVPKQSTRSSSSRRSRGR